MHVVVAKDNKWLLGILINDSGSVCLSVLNRVNMRPVLVGYTLFTVSWVPPQDIFSVFCNTIQFIDNWFWDILQLNLPSGKKASGHTTTENLQNMNMKPRNCILAWLILMIFFVPPDKKICFNKLNHAQIADSTDSQE